MTATLEPDAFLDFAKRKDVKIYAVNVKKDNRYEVDYEATKPIAGNIAPTVFSILDSLSPQGQQSGRGESLSGSDSTGGHSNPPS